MDRPIDTLVTPVYEPRNQSVLDIALGFTQYGSPAYWVNEVLIAALNVDPMGEVSRWLIGDFEAFQRVGTALMNVAEFNTAYEQSMTRGAQLLTETWTGEAASGANNYFTTLAHAIGDQSDSLRDMGRAFHDFSSSAYQFAQTIGSMMNWLIDQAITLAINASAAAALSWTGPGAVALVGAAALQVTLMLNTWSNIISTFDDAVNMARLIVGVLEGASAAVNRSNLPPLPAAAYNNQDT
ncbi:hypothetical protein IEU95_15790 [Hoyosella rhizosphaerae]|uniref:Uncharacterized protein n=1 Tax=Hoyosella rhizosphaerae TaxID=1755582 RepID=A0A916UK60_9ACTN|nr:hypothetical protein [Hoyosella rhizosphaerae]MBN4928297.1 hypothetical protein [Hoyosella rhizosphaerae]GGC73896.1 hypothetical protein GCM10011410_28840 [Hoyosella rhizosphaerae]